MLTVIAYRSYNLRPFPGSPTAVLLLSFAPAPGAVARHENLGINNPKAHGFGDIPSDLTGNGILELNNFAAAQTYQVMVLRG